MPTLTTQTTPGATPADIRRKGDEYAARGDHEAAAILRSVAEEMEAEEQGGASGPVDRVHRGGIGAT